MMQQNEQFGNVVAQCWSDDEFKRKFINDPIAILKTAGVIIPNGVEVRVLENSNKLLHILLPAKPESSLLSEEQLVKIAKNSFDGSCVGKGRAAEDDFCECCGEDMGTM